MQNELLAEAVNERVERLATQGSEQLARFAADSRDIDRAFFRTGSVRSVLKRLREEYDGKLDDGTDSSGEK